jgi:hypothetical protein
MCVVESAFATASMEWLWSPGLNIESLLGLGGVLRLCVADSPTILSTNARKSDDSSDNLERQRNLSTRA